MFKFAVVGPLVVVYLRPRWSGRRHVRRSGGFVLAANHLTKLDPVVVSVGVPRKVVFVAKEKYYTRRPRTGRLVGWFLSAIGQVPIDPANADAAAPALATATRLLRDGGVWAVFPEGTRSGDGRLYRGHTGVMRVALPLGVPVIPVAVQGTREVTFPGRGGWFRGRVTVRYGAPVDLSPWLDRVDDPTAWREATDRLMLEISRLGGQEYAGRYQTAAEIAARGD